MSDKAMTTNQTIDGVPRELLERITAGPSQRDYIKAWKELRALLDAPVNPLSELEVLRAAVKELEAMRDARVDAKLARPRGEPVAYLCKSKGSKWLQYGSVVSDPWLPGEVELTPLYAEQPAPVAVVMPERRADIDSDKPELLMAVASWNACLDEVGRLNASSEQGIPEQSGHHKTELDKP